MSSAPVPRRGGNPVGPALGRLIARRHDLELAGRALSESRLLTFTGPGGVGKTRLALELAYRNRKNFPDGVWLAPLTDLGIGAGVSEVESAVISALGVGDLSAADPRDRLLSFLRNRNLILVVDNCEHVLPAIRQLLPVMLREATQLRVVATSREPVGVVGEVLRPVAPLSVPELGTPATQLVMDGAVSLLMERARAVDPEFEITDDNADAVIALCRLLEGVPLAIELAAAKLRALTIGQIVERFGHRLTALTAPSTEPASRQRSLRAMVDWSYELCPPPAQVVWRRLSVFPASFDLELAEAVCAFGELRREDVIDIIERLVGQSILLTDRSAGGMRYRLLAPLREVAAELADHAGEESRLSRRHRDAMLQRAQTIVDQWWGPAQEKLIAQMRADHAGYIAAIQWSAATMGEQQAGLRLLGLLRYHWLSGGSLAEGRMRLETLLASAPEPTSARAECVWVVIWIALLQGDREQAAKWLAELAHLSEKLGDGRLETHVCQWTALLAMFAGDLEKAIAGFEAAIEGYRRAGDHYLEVSARYMLASTMALAGRATEALSISSSAATACEERGDRSARAYALWAAGIAQWRLGRLDEAERSARAVLRLQRVLSDGICVSLTTDLLAWVAYDRGQPESAAALAVAAGRVWRSLGTSLEAFGPQLSASFERHTPPRSKWPVPQRVSSADRLKDLGDVIALGLGPDRNGTDLPRPVAQPLTKRELEVAGLVESGLSNREIAQRLVISKRTADGHIERILAKLGFSSRAQIAAWVARHGKTRV
ncbi:LuxR C-terminal-related transcriptional regulator [Nocardia sp. NPDC052112]|uniref:ATP-binding protein n=1 Tax=Nocardia sp. NPDC052112 TaxID=3155646 RepID=UPI003449BB40